MFCGGPERIRTADLCNANAALYQLSYRPVFAYPMDFRSSESYSPSFYPSTDRFGDNYITEVNQTEN